MAMRFLFPSLILLSLSALFSIGSSQAASFTPGPTRTPGAKVNHPIDQLHHEDLRDWDRARHLWYRVNARSDAEARNGQTQSDNEDNRELAQIEAAKSRKLEQILAAQRRACLSKYSVDHKAWDRTRSAALRNSLPFSLPPPVKPDCTNPMVSPVASPTSSLLSPSPSASIIPTPATSTSPAPSPAAKPTITPAVFAEAIRECSRKYQKALRDWDQLLQESYREGTVFSDPRPDKPDCNKEAEAYLASIPSPGARLFAW